MDDLILELNHTYLLRYGCTDTVSSITILMITDKAYKVRWNGSGAETWELKRRIYSDYSLVEDISDFVVNKLDEKKFEPDRDFRFYYKYDTGKYHPYFLVEEKCPICGGSGQVHDEHTTSCYKICPACSGSGKASKRVDLLFD